MNPVNEPVNLEQPKKPVALIAVGVVVAIGLISGIAYKFLSHSENETTAPDAAHSSFTSSNAAKPGASATPEQKTGEAVVAGSPDLTVYTAGLSKAVITLTTTHGPIKIKLY